ncbi:hypothetical protein IKQ19_14120 [Candidatus Saccharibacteria bacterium]|nr:hypothetical protein [Candidatus Saccharibacteria bacterium]
MKPQKPTVKIQKIIFAAFFEKAPYAQTSEDWKNLLPWNIEITPFKMRGEWIE